MNVETKPLVADEAALRHAFGTFATGVTIVTVGGDTPHGMTANSFTTVSIDPPLVLVCVGRDALMHQVLEESDNFAISVLASDQEPVARYYADRRRPIGAEQFEFTDWQPGAYSGAPLLADAEAHLECERWQSYDGGDHTIFIGRVLAMRRCEQENALLFLRGRFRVPEDNEARAVVS